MSQASMDSSWVTHGKRTCLRFILDIKVHISPNPVAVRSIAVLHCSNWNFLNAYYNDDITRIVKLGYLYEMTNFTGQKLILLYLFSNSDWIRFFQFTPWKNICFDWELNPLSLILTLMSHQHSVPFYLKM